MKVNKDLIEIMSIQSETYKTSRMENYIKKRLKRMNLGYTTDNYGNIYTTKGYADIYPSMVCHIDTVHDINNNARVVHLEDNLLAIDINTMERYGIGGDDKVGIYITFAMLEHFESFKAVFFLDEESGCTGSSKADFTYFEDCSIVLQCDRRGYDDFVTNISGTILSDETLHNDIDHILTKYNRTKVHGGITDVGQIAENSTVQVANMSCGYYKPHTNNEYIVISEVESTKQMCMEILQTTSHQLYRITSDRISYGYNAYHWDYDYDFRGWGNYGNYGGFKDFNKGKAKSAHSVQDDNYKTTLDCPNCNHNDVWYDSYEDSHFCLSCHTYIDTPPRDDYFDYDYMDTVSDKELIDVDCMLYESHIDHASYNNSFIKDTTNKHLNFNKK